jgi:hypothetical protein
MYFKEIFPNLSFVGYLTVGASRSTADLHHWTSEDIIRIHIPSNPSEFSNTSAAVMHPDHSTEPVCLGTVRSEVESVALRTLVEIGGRGYPRCNITDNINLRAFDFVRATLGYMMRKLENISYGTLNHRRERRKFVRKTKVITSGLQTELYNGVTEGESSKLLVSASVISRFCYAK